MENKIHVPNHQPEKFGKKVWWAQATPQQNTETSPTYAESPMGKYLGKL